MQSDAATPPEGGASAPAVATQPQASATGPDDARAIPETATDAVTAAVFRAFFARGRLQAVPVKRSKRLVVLDHLARAFEPGVQYPESEVNARLQAFHPDYAMLRRYLVDEGFMTRADGIYWRTGGSVDL